MAQNPFGAAICLKDGLGASIYATEEVKSFIDSMEGRESKRLDAIMERLAQFGRNLPREQFRFEDRFKIGDKKGTKAAIYAFKPSQVRIYAGRVHYQSKQTYVCTDYDPSKKQQKADRSIMATAAKKFGQFLEYTRAEKDKR
ncbi:MAG: hypothetical protein MN733_19650 [Nitrososphaera sp.]|nr:hypothetical protein [Nitrososphaera sp.]